MARLLTVFAAVFALALAPAAAYGVANTSTTTTWRTITGTTGATTPYGAWSNDQVAGGPGGTSASTPTQSDYICPPGAPCATTCGIIPSRVCTSFPQSAATNLQRPTWNQLGGALTCIRSNCIDAGNVGASLLVPPRDVTCSLRGTITTYGGVTGHTQCDNLSSRCTAAGVPYPCCTGPLAGCPAEVCAGLSDPALLGSPCASDSACDGTPNSFCTGAGAPIACCTGAGTGTCPPGNGYCTNGTGTCSIAAAPAAGSCPATGGATGCVGAPCGSGVSATCDDTSTGGAAGRGICSDAGANGLFSECNTLGVPTAAAPPGPGTSTPGAPSHPLWCSTAYALPPDEPHGNPDARGLSIGSYSYGVITVPALQTDPSGTAGSNGTGEFFYDGTFVTTQTRWQRGTNTSQSNTACSGAGVPYVCCTGAGTGNCSASKNGQQLIDVVSVNLNLTDGTKTSGHSRVELAEVVPAAVLSSLVDTDPSVVVTTPALFSQTLVSGGAVHNACGEFSTVTDLTTKLQGACPLTFYFGDAFIIPKQALTGTIYPVVGGTTVATCPGTTSPAGECPNIGDSTATATGSGIQAPGVDHCFVQNQLLPAAVAQAGVLGGTVTAIQRSKALTILPPSAGILADSTVLTSLSLYTTNAVDFDGDGVVDCSDNCLNQANAGQADIGAPGTAGNRVGDACDGTVTGAASGADAAESGAVPGVNAADFGPILSNFNLTLADVGRQ